jgi:hypothetical protein
MLDFGIIAERDIIVKRTGKHEVQQVELFDCLPEPSNTELNSILESADPVKAYIDWLFKDAEGAEYEEPIYADDDIWQERPPIGTRTVNARKEHAEMVKSKVDSYIKEGWDVRLVY